MRYRRECGQGDRPPSGVAFPGVVSSSATTRYILDAKVLTALTLSNTPLESVTADSGPPRVAKARPHPSSLLNMAIPSTSQAEYCDQQTLLDVVLTQILAIGFPMSCQDASYPAVSDSRHGANNTKLHGKLGYKRTVQSQTNQQFVLLRHIHPLTPRTQETVRFLQPSPFQTHEATMSGHQDHLAPYVEACGCFLVNGRISQAVTCQGCSGSQRINCNYCGNLRYTYIDCDHNSRNSDRRRLSSHRGSGNRGSGSGSHGMQGGHRGSSGGHHHGGSHGHGSSVSA
ncbi:hypothetical protein B0T14DRAFT_122006 [Immersiella caudata]|uniref:Uncharacterized protein n=1 Tax=Immersiella caudata TaxID=314043 RepID=A0AA39X417_9PEZI|nr:hypothetical protein B0T14DRAFT_122006 [Immersiella caudata]